MKISIITATYNASSQLPRLIDSLRKQSDKNFEWVVTDGGSTDGTLEVLQQIDDLNLVIDTQPDFGIYDALNRAIGIATGEYYLVLGADDILYENAISLFYQNMDSKADLVTALVKIEGRELGVRRPWPWLYGQFAYVSSHAVGTLISKKLHEVHGLYSRHFPIAADQLFLKKVAESKETKILEVNFVAGEFGTTGTSNQDLLGTFTESLRVQIVSGENKFLQLLLFFLRVIKNYSKI